VCAIFLYHYGLLLGVDIMNYTIVCCVTGRGPCSLFRSRVCVCVCVRVCVRVCVCGWVGGWVFLHRQWRGGGGRLSP